MLLYVGTLSLIKLFKPREKVRDKHIVTAHLALSDCQRVPNQQSASETRPLFNSFFIRDSSGLFPFGELSMTEGARLIVRELEGVGRGRERDPVFQTRGRPRTFLRPYVSGLSFLSVKFPPRPPPHRTERGIDTTAL